jgi:glycosyltransferase involved in cell wall biosynthesis
MPAFNEALRIGEAIESIRKQTEPPAEIVVVDDGSTDATASVAESLGARVIRQANAGPAAARNRAIREAASPWIAFCDADDLWLPQKLELTRRAHEMRPGVDLLFADCCNDVGGRITLPSVFSATSDFGDHVAERAGPGVSFFEGASLARGLVKLNFMAISTVVVRRRLLLDRSLYFNPSLPHGRDYLVAEDIEWYLRLLKATDALAVEQVVMQYRRHPGSLSADQGRLHYGLVKLGELVAAAPDRYPEGLAQACARERRRHVRDAALSDARAHWFRDARERFAEAQEIAFRPSDEVLRWLTGAASLPGGHWFARAGRSAWQRALKPALRAIGRRGS